MRILSLQPTSTEMAFALGLGRSVVGVSHECTYPPAARRRPIVSRSVIDPDRMSSAEIDRAVAESERTGKSLYRIDRDLVRTLRPDLILTQSLCEVCATAPSDVAPLLGIVSPRPRVVPLHAHDFEGMFADLRLLAEETGKDPRPLEGRLRRRIEAVDRKIRKAPRRKVFCLEWLDPPFASGHWVPEMVERAGGHDGLARAGKPSRRIEWSDLAAYAPEALILMPCGFTMKRTRREARIVTDRPEWKGLPAVKSGDVWLVDGPSYFNGAGPRLVDGLEILAGILHPDRFPRRRLGCERL
jgi:iron complex transport system substrate-binding protein